MVLVYTSLLGIGMFFSEYLKLTFSIANLFYKLPIESALLAGTRSCLVKDKLLHKLAKKRSAKHRKNFLYST